GKYVNGLWDATDKAGESAKKTAPMVLGLGGGSDDAAASAKEHAAQVKKEQEELDKLHGKVRELESAMPGLHKAITDNIDDSTIAGIKRQTEAWDKANEKI